MPRIPAARDRVQWIEHVWSIILTRIEERYTLTISANLIVMDCASCGVVFVVTEEFRARRQETGEGFYCPNGHSLVYTSRIAELEAKLKRERRKAHEWQNSYQGERRRHEATERQLINCAVGNHPHTYGSDDAGSQPLLLPALRRARVAYEHQASRVSAGRRGMSTGHTGGGNSRDDALVEQVTEAMRR